MDPFNGGAIDAEPYFDAIMSILILVSQSIQDSTHSEVFPLKKAQTGSVSRELRNIRRSFVNIARSFEKLAPALAAATSGPSRSANGHTSTGRKRPTLSPAQMKALRLQGQYMGTMRGLSIRGQARVKAVRKSRGIHAAIAEARRLAR
jgi:hypothetical protein